VTIGHYLRQRTDLQWNPTQKHQIATPGAACDTLTRQSKTEGCRNPLSIGQNILSTLFLPFPLVRHSPDQSILHAAYDPGLTVIALLPKRAGQRHANMAAWKGHGSLRPPALGCLSRVLSSIVSWVNQMGAECAQTVPYYEVWCYLMRVKGTRAPCRSVAVWVVRPPGHQTTS